MSEAPTRPVLRYHGGKWRLAPWVIEHFPPHSVYVEPFGGGASVLLRKPRSNGEIYNDLDGRIVHLFTVLRDPATAAELIRRIELTPYARAEHALSYEPIDDPIEAARRTVVRGLMGHGSRGATSSHRAGFRTARSRGFGAESEWSRYPRALRSVVVRLRGVLIECRPGADVVAEYDAPDSLHYIDPPYPGATRTESSSFNGRVYQHDMSDDDHRALAAVLHRVKGMVVLSGYPCDLYDSELYPTWERHTTIARADRRAERIEAVWLNPHASLALAESPAQHGLEGIA